MTLDYDTKISNDADTLLTTDQLALLRKVPRSRIEKERMTGGGPPFVKDGRLVRYRLGDYRSWVASQQRHTMTDKTSTDNSSVDSSR